IVGAGDRIAGQSAARVAEVRARPAVEVAAVALLPRIDDTVSAPGGLTVTVAGGRVVAVAVTRGRVTVAVTRGRIAIAVAARHVLGDAGVGVLLVGHGRLALGLEGVALLGIVGATEREGEQDRRKGDSKPAHHASSFA